MRYYIAASINPWNHHPARRFKHKIKDCPLLNNWGGQILERPVSGGLPRCPFCFNKKTLEKARKAERLWHLMEPTFFLSTLYNYLEITKTKRQLKREAELML